MRHLLIFAFFIGLGISAQSQLNQVISSVFYTDDGTVPDYPTGHTTYRIYALLEDPTDFLSSVYATGAYTLSIGSNTNTIWNSGFGATTGDAVNIAFFGFVPSLEYDSFVTIGRANSSEPGSAINLIESIPGTAVVDGFGTTGPADEFDTNVTLLDGAWYALNGDINGLGIGPENKVLLAQVTTDGELQYCLNIQVFPLSEGANAQHVTNICGSTQLGGCIDTTSCNYNSNAMEDDGSCCYTLCGCTDSIAGNYDSSAECDDGSCQYYGCTDQAACNYDYSAAIDDGSCILPDGCTDSLADNYSSTAQCDDGSCLYSGCMDVNACNFDSNANVDNGSCNYDFGCTSSSADNYNSTALCDDGTCIYGDEGLSHVFHEIAYTDDGTISGYPTGFTTYRIYASLSNPTDFLSSVYATSNDVLEIGSSTNTIWNNPAGGVTADNLNPAFFPAFPETEWDSMITIGKENLASSGGSIQLIESSPGTAVETGFGIATSGNVTMVDGAWYALNGDANGLGVGSDLRVLIAQITTDGDLEYNLNIQVFPLGIGADARLYIGDCNTLDSGEYDGSAIGLHYPPNPLCIGSCTDPLACNYDSNAGEDDGSCCYDMCGCTNFNATNYDSSAECNDGSCYYSGCMDNTACNYDPAASIDDGSCILPDGCIDSSADNYNSTASCDDGSCLYSGCTDETACNYDSGANLDDGSCVLAAGCMDTTADNYDSTALCDDGTCEYSGVGLSHVFHEVYYTDDATVTGYPSGYTTYRIYASLSHPTDFLSSVYASNNNVIEIGSNTNTIWNSGFGATTGDSVNAAFFGFVPAIEYDSFVTIGRANNTEPGSAINLIESIPGTAVTDGFGTGGVDEFDTNVTMLDGAWFALNGDINGLGVGGDLRVLLAQITTDGDLEYNLNLQVFIQGEGLNSALYVGDCNTVNDGNIDGSTMGLHYPIDYSCWNGCMDITACNYNSLVQEDDGSCCYTMCGCTDSSAVNYDSSATCDDGTCQYLGCIDLSACNFDPQANTDDGSCILPDGCTDPNAANYDSSATCDDGTCQYLGCIDLSACNFDPQANTDDGSCILPDGCTDNMACNYDSTALCDNQTCAYPGCTDSVACNYDFTAGCDDGSCQYEAIVEGYVFNDANQDGNFDGAFWNEPGLSNWQVEIVELGWSTFTNADGYYQFFNVPAGSYTLTISNIMEGWVSTTTIEVGITTSSCVVENINFGFAAEGTSSFWLNGPCCIWLMDIHCENGFNPGLWINNTGSMPLNGTVTVSFSSVLEAEPLEGNVVEPTDISPGIVTWDLNDSPYGGQSLLFQCHINGPGFEFMGEQFDITINVSLEDDGVEYYNNSWVLEPIVVCSYDPNDKYAAEPGYTEEHFILPDNSIEYRIRFQNTGNFAAEDITITDMLDIERLDMETFQPMFGSHSYMTCVQADGQVDFIFEDIFLPDSASNEPGSQGYVVYRITPMEGIEPGEVINNTANIYFDSNPAIVTNTTWHTIMDCVPVPEFSVSNDQLCLGDVLTLETTSDYADEVIWFVDEEEIGDGNSIDFTAEDTGTYQIDVEVSNPLCNETSTQSVTINPLPTATFTEDGVILTASSGTSFQWYLDGNPIDGATDQTWEALENGDYSVEVTNEFNCSDISEEITVIVIGVEELQDVSLSIYPNPIRETATLFFGELGGSYDVQIISTSGQLVRSYENIADNSLILQKRDIAAGTYVLRVIDRQNSLSSELKIVFE